MSAVLIGCATIPQGKPEARPIEAYPMHSTADGLAVGCETLTEEARLQKVFGNDLVARGMLPVILTVRNDSNGTVALREQDILLAVVGTAEISVKNTDHLARIGPDPALLAVAALLGPLHVLNAYIGHVNLEYDRQNRLSEIALRSTTLAPGNSTTGVVYFPIARSWLANAPTDLVVVAVRLGEGHRIAVRVPLGATLAGAVARGIKH